MTVKNKIRLGFGFVVVLFLVFIVNVLFYIQAISTSTRAILTNNYETLHLTAEMRQILDLHPLPLKGGIKNDFERYLLFLEDNSAEKGGRDATAKLRKAFGRVDSTLSNKQGNLLEGEIRNSLRAIEASNMNAILEKDTAARQIMERAVVVLTLLGISVFLLLFTFSLNFPSMVFEPLAKLVNGIRATSLQNDSKRPHFKNKDEFAEIATAFHDMAADVVHLESRMGLITALDTSRINAVIEQTHDAVIGTDENDKVLFVNSAARKIFNLTDQNVCGLPVIDLAPNESPLNGIVASEDAPVSVKISSAGKNFLFQLETKEIFHTEDISLSNPDLNSCQKVYGGKVLLMKNITGLTEIGGMRTDFRDKVSGVLDSSGSIIQSTIDELKAGQKGILTHAQKKLLQNISNQYQHLANVVREVLKLKTTDSENVPLHLVLCTPGEIVDHAVAVVRSQAEDKNIRLMSIVGDNLGTVSVDVEKTTWVLVNFLSNAFRYSKANSDVIINVHEMSDNIIFSVKDFGIGIAGHMQSGLFDRYVKFSPGNQKKAGAGLGLSISKDFIVAQGGEIGVESIVGEGCRFFFKLPKFIQS